MRREHFLATVVLSLGAVFGGGGYGVSTINTKLEAQTKEIVELRLDLGAFKATRAEADKATAKTDAEVARIAADVNDLKRTLATQAYQLAEHDRRLAERK